jgi:hypothetical protein
MQQRIGGRRPGAGRPKGSKNKMTIAREAIAEVLDIDDARSLGSEVHKRGHTLLAEMERIAYDVTQPVGARIMAAKTILPFMLPKREIQSQDTDRGQELVELLQQRRRQLATPSLR